MAPSSRSGRSKGKPAKAAKKSSSKQASPRERLEQELIGMIEQIDEEGLVFLTKQAHVLIHNMQVDKINRAIDNVERSRGEAAEQGVSAHDGRETAEPVRITDAGGGKAYILVIEGARKMLSLEEMRCLVKICYAAEDARDGGGRLYNWLCKNRKDVLIDAAIGRRSHPALAALYEHIKSRYKPRDEA